MNKLEYTKSDLIELQELCDSLSNKVDFLIDRNDEKQEVLNKIKEYLINNANKDLSVDSYYKLKDLSEYDDILELLEEIK